MGIHEWSYDNDISNEDRFKVPHVDKALALGDVRLEVELGFDRALGYREAQRCLNCDTQTVFAEPLCIECDACADICPTDCITFTTNGDEADLRGRLKAPAPNLDQAIFVSAELRTGRIMAKDEDVCLHCGLCAERCPTGAWDMQRFVLEMSLAGTACSVR
jgi:ferredoxin